MSSLLIGHALKARMGTQSRKLVLVKLVDAADDDGTNIWPSLERVAAAAECSVRQVQRVIAEFWKAGLLEKIKEGGKGPGSTVEWKLSVEKLFSVEKIGWFAFSGTPEPEANDTKSTLEPDETDDVSTLSSMTSATEKVDSRSPQTPPYPSEDSLSRENLSGFERLWIGWPAGARGNRSKALSRWGAVPADQTEPAELFAPSYRSALAAAGRTFVPAVETYLADEPWHGQPIPTRSTESEGRVTAFKRTWWWVWAHAAARGLTEAEKRIVSGALKFGGAWPVDPEKRAEFDAAAERDLAPFEVHSDHTKKWRSHYRSLGIDMPIPDKVGWVFLPEHPPPDIGKAISAEHQDFERAG